MLKAAPSQAIRKALHMPGDKSISHRAVILGSLCEGTIRIQHFLESEDCLHAVKAMKQLGVRIEQNKQELIIYGQGLLGLKASDEPIDCGNAGTLMRLLAGLLSAQPFDSVLIGDSSLSQRPMDRIIKPLGQMGATIVGRSWQENTVAPLSISGGAKLKGISYSMPVASAQVKSALMLASLYATGKTLIEEPHHSRDHTERMLALFGAPVQIEGKKIHMTSKPLIAADIDIPGDISSAAFFIVAATLIQGSHLFLKHVGLNPARLGVIRILKAMGADIKVTPHSGFEPVGDIEVKASKLSGIEIPRDWIVSAIDECPIIFVAASFAKGKTVLREASELRVKEVDRIEVMADNLKACGIKLQTFEDGLAIEGGDFKGGQVASKGDHRVAMAFAIAGCCANYPVYIDDYACINTSFPSFIKLAKQCGLKLTIGE